MNTEHVHDTTTTAHVHNVVTTMMDHSNHGNDTTSMHDMMKVCLFSND
jgi:hypothetical protein